MEKNKQIKLFAAIGGALYNSAPNWREQLARDLDVETATVRNWARGHSDIDRQPGVYDDIIKRVTEKRMSLFAIHEFLVNTKKQLKRSRIRAIV